MLIQANNYEFEEAEKTLLVDPVSAGATTVNVKNTEGFSDTTYVILGEIGTEKAEIVSISAVASNTQLTVSATKFAHSEGDPITYARYNQIRFYMSSSSGGTFTLQTTEDMEVDNANKITVWDDTDGVSTNYYKISYYNDLTSLESDKSDEIPGSGTTTNTVRYLTDEILKEARDESEAMTSRQEILDWMNDCHEDVQSRRKKWSYLYTRAAASRGASQEYYSLSTAFNVTNVDKIDHLDYIFDDGTTDETYRLRYIPHIEFDYKTQNNDLDESDELQLWTWDEATDYIRVYPKPDTSASTVFYLYYYKNFTELDSDGDVPEIPDKRIYKYYCLAQFHLKKDDQRKHDYYSAKYEQAVANLARKERKEVGQPHGFKYQPDNERRWFKY